MTVINAHDVDPAAGRLFSRIANRSGLDIFTARHIVESRLRRGKIPYHIRRVWLQNLLGCLQFTTEKEYTSKAFAEWCEEWFIYNSALLKEEIRLSKVQTREQVFSSLTPDGEMDEDEMEAVEDWLGAITWDYSQKQVEMERQMYEGIIRPLLPCFRQLSPADAKLCIIALAGFDNGHLIEGWRSRLRGTLRIDDDELKERVKSIAQTLRGKSERNGYRLSKDTERLVFRLENGAWWVDEEEEEA